MTKKDKEELLEVFKEFLVTSLMPHLDSLSEGVHNHADHLQEMRAQLDRIEHKLDLIIAHQSMNKNWIFPKKKIARS